MRRRQNENGVKEIVVPKSKPPVGADRSVGVGNPEDLVVSLEEPNTKISDVGVLKVTKLQELLWRKNKNKKNN